MTAVVIYNGPSRLEWRGQQWPGRVIGCNFAYRDWPLTDCVSIDRMTVAAIRGELEGRPLPCEMWTRDSNLELPPGWQQRAAPGIDSGSLAVSLALDLCVQVMVIGADGICGGSVDTAYEYRWHRHNSLRQIHQRHRRTLQELTKGHPGRISVVWPNPVEGLDIISREQAQQRLDKYLISE